MRKLLLTSASLGVLAMASTGTALACDPDYSGVELTATTQTGRPRCNLRPRVGRKRPAAR